MSISAPSKAAPRWLPFLIALAVMLTLASCEALSSWLGPPPPPQDEVAAWEDLELILNRIEARTGTQGAISAIREALADLDGDKLFLLEVLRPLIEPQPWAAGFADPLALYSAIVGEDTSLSENGLKSRLAAAATLRDSIRGMLD